MTMTHIWRSEDNLWKPIFFLSIMWSLGYLVLSFGGKCPYSLSHLTSSASFARSYQAPSGGKSTRQRTGLPENKCCFMGADWLGPALPCKSLCIISFALKCFFYSNYRFSWSLQNDRISYFPSLRCPKAMLAAIIQRHNLAPCACHLMPSFSLLAPGWVLHGQGAAHPIGLPSCSALLTLFQAPLLPCMPPTALSRTMYTV